MDSYEELKRLHTETERYYLILKEKEEIVDLLLQLHDQVDQYVQALGFQLPDYLKVPPEIYEAVKEPTPPPKGMNNAGYVPPPQQAEPEPEPQPEPEPEPEPVQQTTQEQAPTVSHYQKIPNMSRPPQRAASVSVVPSKQAQPAATPTPPSQQSQYMAIPTKSKSFTIVETAAEDVPPPPAEPELPTIPPEADPKWYFGSINRSEAEALLLQCGKNSLLVRNSSVPGCFALSIFFQNTRKIAHILIQMNSSGGKILWSLENSIDTNVYENFMDILLQSPECHNHVFAGLLVPNNHWSPETQEEQNQAQAEPEQQEPEQQPAESAEAQPAEAQQQKEETEEEKKLRFRKRVIEEIIQTEKDYTNDLGVLVKHYSSVLSKKESKVISQEDVQKLFSNLSEILDINYSVLNTLEQRKRKGSSGGQYIVGDAFLKIAEDFKPYTIYCINHPVALKTLEKLRASNPGFVQFEKKTSIIPETKGIGLVGFLIKPVQRICKYPILLKELLKFTPPSHVEYENLQAALDKIEQVVDYINERKRMAESNEKLTSIQNMIEGLESFSLPKPTRELVMELSVKKVMKKNALSDYMLWVFNDLFLYAKVIKKDKYKYKGRVGLDALRVIDVIDSDDVKNAFEIEDRNHLDAEKLLMSCNSEKDKKFLLNETKKVIKDYYIQHHDQLQAEANARKYLAEFQFKETDINKLKELQAKKPPAPVKLTSNQNLLAVLQQQQLEKALSSGEESTEPTPEPKSPFANLNRQKSSSVSVVPSRTKPPPPQPSSGSAPSSPSNSFISLNKSPSTESTEPQKEAVTLVFNTGGSTTGAVPQRATRRAPVRPVSVRSPLQPQGSSEDLASLNSSTEDLSKFAASSEDLKVLVHSSSTESIGSQQSPSTSTDKLPNLPPPAESQQPAQPAPDQQGSPKVTALPVKTARSSPIKRVSSQGTFQ